MFEFTEEKLEALRVSLAGTMSEKRYRHTVAVSDMVGRMAVLYLPEGVLLLRTAGLLHDITKEYSTEKQLKILHEYGIITTKMDELSPKTLHARTAALLIPDRYPEFAHPMLISAIRWHTTGHKNMTLAEKLLYLADYIDDSRTFPDCVALRERFWSAEPEKMSDEARVSHLDAVIVDSFDRTIRSLLEEGALISTETVEARDELVEAKLLAAGTKQ